MGKRSVLAGQAPVFSRLFVAGDMSCVQSMLETTEVTPECCSPHKVSNSIQTRDMVIKQYLSYDV